MDTTITYFLLAASGLLNVTILAIAIGRHWPDIINRLNEKMSNGENDFDHLEEEQAIPNSNSPKTKLLYFQNSGGTSELMDFFSDNHEILWNNHRLN